MKEVVVYEVDSDRGVYWESDPFVPEIWDSKLFSFGVVEHGPHADAIVASAVMKMVRQGYEVTIKSQEAYLLWLLENSKEAEPEEKIPYWELD